MRLRIVLFVLLIAPASCKAHPAPTSATATAKAVFRFSPRPNHAAAVHWRAWDPAVFAEARAQHKPILLSLAAIWCHWCHVLDETTLSDPRVIALLNRDFLPVRVDADQHPEVERRYLLGCWPTVAFLTPQGGIIDGGTYVPPDAFVALGESALAAFREGGAALNDHLARYRQREDPVRPGPVDAQIVETVARTLGGEADRKNGGFGGAPKFPNGEAVTLLFAGLVSVFFGVAEEPPQAAALNSARPAKPAMIDAPNRIALFSCDRKRCGAHGASIAGA